MTGRVRERVHKRVCSMHDLVDLLRGTDSALLILGCRPSFLEIYWSAFVLLISVMFSIHSSGSSSSSSSSSNISVVILSSVIVVSVFLETYRGPPRPT